MKHSRIQRLEERLYISLTLLIYMNPALNCKLAELWLKTVVLYLAILFLWLYRDVLKCYRCGLCSC